MGQGLARGLPSLTFSDFPPTEVLYGLRSVFRQVQDQNTRMCAPHRLAKKACTKPRPDDAPPALVSTLPPPPSSVDTLPGPRYLHSRLHPPRHRRRHPRSPWPASSHSVSLSPSPSERQLCVHEHPARRRATPDQRPLRVASSSGSAPRPGMVGARAEARACSAWQPVDQRLEQVRLGMQLSMGWRW